jgi:hypothetical protein
MSKKQWGHGYYAGIRRAMDKLGDLLDDDLTDEKRELMKKIEKAQREILRLESSNDPIKEHLQNERLFEILYLRSELDKL